MLHLKGEASAPQRFVEWPDWIARLQKFIKDLNYNLMADHVRQLSTRPAALGEKRDGNAPGGFRARFGRMLDRMTHGITTLPESLIHYVGRKRLIGASIILIVSGLLGSIWFVALLPAMRRNNALSRAELEPPAKVPEQATPSNPVPTTAASPNPTISTDSGLIVERFKPSGGRGRYLSEDVDRMTKHLRGVADSGETTLTLSKLEELAGREPGEPDIIAQIALLNEARRNSEGAAEAWSQLLQIGPSTGALYQLATAKVKALPPDQKPDRGLQPSKDAAEQTTETPSSAESPAPSPSLILAAPTAVRDGVRNNRSWQAWIGDFVKQFVTANGLQDVNTDLDFYAAKVNYFGDPEKDHAFIRSDVEKYNERWPIRRDSIEGDIHLQEKVPDQQYSASFKLNFYAESTPRAVWTKGEFLTDLEIAIFDGVPKIVGIKQKMLRQQKGKPATAAKNPIKATRPPSGLRVPGKPGFAKSPYAPSKGELDLRRFRKGAEVKCPFTGKIFTVP
jgi:hypothetical protein